MLVHRLGGSVACNGVMSLEPPEDRVPTEPENDFSLFSYALAPVSMPERNHPPSGTHPGLL